MAVKLIDELQKEIKAAGEAVTQEAYEKAFDHTFQILDNLEILETSIRSLQRDRMKKRGYFHMEEKSFQKIKNSL